jgi:hypothetical protein
MKYETFNAFFPVRLRDFEDARRHYLNSWQSLTKKDDDLVDDMLQQSKRIVEYLKNENPALLNEFLCATVVDNDEGMKAVIKSAALIVGGGAQEIFRDRTEEEYDGWERFDFFWDSWLA